MTTKTVTLNLPPAEFNHLHDYCQKVQRTKNDLLREVIRALPSTSNGLGSFAKSVIDYQALPTLGQLAINQEAPNGN